MRRVPIFATLLVLAAVAVMIGLGFWQLQRKGEKEAQLAVLQSNPSLPAIAYPPMAPVDTTLLFRPTSVNCLRVIGWQVEGGKAANGQTGFRHIAQCATGAEGPGALVNMGVDQHGDWKPTWNGGHVTGWLSEEPDHRSLFSRMLGSAPPLRPMLVSGAPASGLTAAAVPKADDVPNNHLAYAVQWFLFAGIALIIYALALRRRMKDDGSAE